MEKKDYQEGIYRDGKFMPYSMYGEYHAKLDPLSNKEAVEVAQRGEVIHGSFKEGNFRPAEGKTRAGFMSKISLPSGEVLKYDFRGDVQNSSGTVLGRLDENGKLTYLAQTRGNATEDSKVDYSRRGMLKDHASRRRMGTTKGDRDFYKTSEATNIANFLIKSNRVLGKLGARNRDYQISEDIQVYESEIPEFYRDRNGLPVFTGYNGTTDKGETVITIDSRLKPYEKLAILAHELAHVAQGHNPRTIGERRANEQEAQTRAIKQLTKLYEDYGTLQKSVKGSEATAFFNAGSIAKRDITKAIGLLVNSRGYFGVDNRDLEEHTSTFRQVFNDLEGMVAVFVSFFGILSGLFLLSSNITGNVIATLTTKTTSLLGVGLLIIGLIAGFFYLKTKRK